jgi:hypothetical protein
VIWQLPLLLAVALFLGNRWELLQRAGAAFARALESRWAPLAIAVVSAVIFTLAWGSLRQIPVIHDEASYLLQAKLFAMGKWTADPPPMPSFFEQFHVFVVPRFASKYPPGHPLLLVPGIWLGLPGLMPVVLSAVAAALFFSIVRRLHNGTVALWAWIIWISTPFVLWIMASYFSQSTSAVCWLGGWYALLRWRESANGRWLLILAAAVAWLGLTRPLTALGYAIPVGVYVLLRVSRTGQWRALVGAMALGFVMLLAIPFWSEKTIGTWRTTPYSLYSKLYFPWDSPGFGLDSAPPSRDLPPDMKIIAEVTAPTHRGYVLSAMPRVLGNRLAYVARDMWGAPRLVLIAFALIGVFFLSAEMAFALGSALVLMITYLWFGHHYKWTVYYAEIQPVLATVTAIGLWRVLRWRAHPVGSRVVPAAAAAASLVLALGAGLFERSIIRVTNARNYNNRAYQGAFLSMVNALPAEKAIVFVRYGPNHNPHTAFVYNDPDLANAKRWIVYDRGPENLQLLKLAPGRVGYLYDEGNSSISQYGPDGKEMPVLGTRR